MKLLNFPLVNFVLMTLLISGCQSKTEKNQEFYMPVAATSREAAAAAELGRDVVVTVGYTPGEIQLSEEAINQIENALASARKTGTVKNVDVAAWSDSKYPQKGKKLTREQIDLAKKRAINVRRFIDRIEPESQVNTYNMAKQPNAFQKWLNTRDVYVKNKLIAAGIVSRTEDDVIFDQTSSAMVFIEVR